MKSQDIAIVGILLAVGAIVRYLSLIIPGSIVSNLVIAFLLPCHYTCNTHIHGSYRYRDCCRHSVRASQSLHIPPANLISEPVGAVACLVTYKALRNNFSLSPAPSTLIGTLVSGTTFVIVAMVRIAPAILSKFTTMGAFAAAVIPIVVFNV